MKRILFLIITTVIANNIYSQNIENNLKKRKNVTINKKDKSILIMTNVDFENQKNWRNSRCCFILPLNGLLKCFIFNPKTKDILRFPPETVFYHSWLNDAQKSQQINFSYKIKYDGGLIEFDEEASFNIIRGILGYGQTTQFSLSLKIRNNATSINFWNVEDPAGALHQLVDML